MHKPVPFTRGKLVILYASMVLTIAAAIIFAIYTADHTAQSIIAERQAAAQDSMRPVCTYIKAQLDVYADTPPTTPTGQKLLTATKDVYQTFGCSTLPPK